MAIAAVMVYGARFIVLKVFKFPEEESLRPLLILKIAGILVALLGMLKIFDVL